MVDRERVECLRKADDNLASCTSSGSRQARKTAAVGVNPLRMLKEALFQLNTQSHPVSKRPH